MPSRHLAARSGLRCCFLMLALAIAGAALAQDKPTPAAAPSRPSASPSSTPARVDLNLASEADLEALPKIGPATAKRIVEYRKQVGTIKSVDELVNVQGIGEKTLEVLRPHVTVGISVPAPSAPKRP